MQQVISYLESNFERFLQELAEFSRIPGVSAVDFPQEPLEESAHWVKKRMEQAGLVNVEILKIQGVPPYIYGDWLSAEDKPTILLYAHHDVQPPGREEYWTSPAFEPQQRGGRLYGRGVADDKAGFMLHIAAIEAFLKTKGTLPVNVRFIVEGEEETGSANLAEFLEKNQEKLKSDVMVLTDTVNLEAGLPSITYRLRGVLDAYLEVRVLRRPVHSGMWGGPVMDALSALNQILSRLLNPSGEIAIPGFYEDVLALSPSEKRNLSQLPFCEEKFRQEVGAVPSLKWAGSVTKSVYEKIWCEPALAVLGIDAPSVATTSNKIIEWARAKISVRTVNNQNPEKILKLLCDFLKQDPPWGVEVKVTPGVAAPSWMASFEGPVFKIAEDALEKGFGKKPVYIGCGGSIGFVEPLTKAFPHMLALLIGVEDPLCNAHGEDESLLIDDFRKAMLSSVYLLEGLQTFSKVP